MLSVRNVLGMKVKSQSRSVMSDSLQPHGILQARIMEWVAFSFSRGSSQPRDQTQVSHIEGRFFTSRATRKPKCTSNKIYVNRSKEEKKKKGKNTSHKNTYQNKARMVILISVKEISTNFKHMLTYV